MNQFIYLHDQGDWLARRWLAAHGAEGPVTLLCDAAGRPAAEALRTQHPSVTAVHALDAADAVFTPPNPPRVVLPVSCDMVPLRYNPPVQMPDVAPLYPLIRRLWTAGFREFELFSLAGSRTLAVPHLLDVFRNRHKGHRCFVVGNGPSLNAIDMMRLKDEYHVEAGYEPMNISTVRWFDEGPDARPFMDGYKSDLALDIDGDPVFLVSGMWRLEHVQELFPRIQFRTTKEHR